MRRETFTNNNKFLQEMSSAEEQQLANCLVSQVWRRYTNFDVVCDKSLFLPSNPNVNAVTLT